MKADTRQNFISTDQKTVRNSYGTYFTVGEEVGHEGAEDTATIIGFAPNIEQNEIRVYTTKGFAHIDFLVKLKEDRYFTLASLKEQLPRDEDVFYLTGLEYGKVRLRDIHPNRAFLISGKHQFEYNLK